MAKLRILLMDDDTLVREVTSNILTYLGHEVIPTKDGNEAINVYHESNVKGKPFDIVILDLVIPGGLGGTETMKKLLEIDPNCKSIVYSGYSDDPIIQNYKKYGFSAAIIKPAKLDEIKTKIENLIK